MSNFSRFYEGAEGLSPYPTVLAFDPGGTTGFAALTVCQGGLEGMPGAPRRLEDALIHIEYGQIDCGTKHGQTGVGMERGHASMNMPGENRGVVRMLELATREFPKAAIVFEDFIVDFNQITSDKDALSPVRLTSAFTFGLDLDVLNNEIDDYDRARREPLERIFIQNRSLAKTTCTDLRLKHWGLYDYKSGPHARDAVRHALFFLRCCSSSNLNSEDAAEKRHLAWPDIYDDPFAKNKKSAETKAKVSKALTAVGERIYPLK